MDFVTGLPTMFHKNNVIWVVVDCLTKSTHFILIRKDFPIVKFTKLHGVPWNIVSYRDP